MLLEMSFIQMFTRFLGDTVVAAAVVVGCFLLFAGMGSMSQPFLTERIPGGVVTPIAVIVTLVLIDATLIPRLFSVAALFSTTWKVLAGVCIIAPLAFFMGTPFPWGLSVLQRSAGKAIPIAWAVNGFASVVSASAAVVLAMTFGFKDLLSIAACVYGVSGVVSFCLARGLRSHIRGRQGKVSGGY
jgi:predicted membrane-bound spermidine synthase